MGARYFHSWVSCSNRLYGRSFRPEWRSAVNGVTSDQPNCPVFWWLLLFIFTVFLPSSRLHHLLPYCSRILLGVSTSRTHLLLTFLPNKNTAVNIHGSQRIYVKLANKISKRFIYCTQCWILRRKCPFVAIIMRKLFESHKTVINAAIQHRDTFRAQIRHNMFEDDIIMITKCVTPFSVLCSPQNHW